MHVIHDKEKLVLRARRLTGQVKAVEKHLQNNEDCIHILQHLSACRGALNSLMAELIDEHIHFHVLDPKKKPSRAQTEAAAQLMEIVSTYLK